MRKLLICTVGLPRSGKSTWARQQGVPVVNPDSIRLSMHGQRFQPLAEPLVWATAKIMVRALFIAGHNVVIVDATNTTKRRRDEWLDPDWTVNFQYIDTPSQKCIDRALAAGDVEIVPIIAKMAAQWEPIP